MANEKITEMAALTNPALNDLLPIVDVSGGTTNKITLATLISYLDSQSMSGENIYYVGKDGNDSNDGLSILSAKLTITGAIDAIGALSPVPAADNKFVICILDAGEYDEDVELPDYCMLYGPNAKVQGEVSVDSGNHWYSIVLKEIEGDSDGNCLNFDTLGAVGEVYFDIAKLVASGTTSGIGLRINTGGHYYGKIGRIETAYRGCYIANAAGGSIEIDEIVVTGTSNTVGIYAISNNADLVIRVGQIDADTGGTSYGIYVHNNSLTVIAGVIVADSAWYNDGTLYILAGRYTGAPTGSGTTHKTIAGYIGKSANDVNALTGVTPATDDVMLIEDQSDSWNKKKSTIANLLSLVSIAHNDTTSKQGGTTDEYYHLTSARHTDVIKLPLAFTFEYQFDSTVGAPVDG